MTRKYVCLGEEVPAYRRKVHKGEGSQKSMM